MNENVNCCLLTKKRKISDLLCYLFGFCLISILSIFLILTRKEKPACIYYVFFIIFYYLPFCCCYCRFVIRQAMHIFRKSLY